MVLCAIADFDGKLERGKWFPCFEFLQLPLIKVRKWKNSRQKRDCNGFLQYVEMMWLNKSLEMKEYVADILFWENLHNHGINLILTGCQPLILDTTRIHTQSRSWKHQLWELREQRREGRVPSNFKSRKTVTSTWHWQACLRNWFHWWGTVTSLRCSQRRNRLFMKRFPGTV